METFWFFWLRFRRAYDSAYDCDFWFSLGHKRSYDSAYDSDSDSVASENQPLELVHTSDANASAKIRKQEWTVSTQTQVPMQQIKWESINQ